MTKMIKRSFEASSLSVSIRSGPRRVSRAPVVECVSIGLRVEGGCGVARVEWLKALRAAGAAILGVTTTEAAKLGAGTTELWVTSTEWRVSSEARRLRWNWHHWSARLTWKTRGARHLTRLLHGARLGNLARNRAWHRHWHWTRLGHWHRHRTWLRYGHGIRLRNRHWHWHRNYLSLLLRIADLLRRHLNRLLLLLRNLRNIFTVSSREVGLLPLVGALHHSAWIPAILHNRARLLTIRYRGWENLLSIGHRDRTRHLTIRRRNHWHRLNTWNRRSSDDWRQWLLDNAGPNCA